nr:LOW QUALITY PROTEIN: poly [ADP-ribose] polymerase tankyrase-like [Lepeophtheirus salmonis]
MGGAKKLVYPRGSFLIIHGDDGSLFWTCKSNQHFYEGMKDLKVLWLEKKASKENEWVLTSSVDRVPASSIIRKSKMSRVQGNSYSMTLSELKKNKDYGTKFVKELGEIPEQDEDTKSPIKPKRFKNEKQSNKKSTKKSKVSSKVKRVKVKIDKTNPNWRLKPRDHVTVYDSDPFFESSSMDFPFISTTHHSRLIIRSILLKDKKLLKSLIDDNEKVSSLTIRRSLANDMVPMMYAIMAEDRDAIKILVSKEASNKSRAPSPIQMIETTSTGIYNYRSLGIKNIRQIEASRGGREGNNALTKDDTKSKSDLYTFILSKKLSVDFVEFLIEENVVRKFQFWPVISKAFFNDNLKIALYLFKKHIKSSEFTDLHVEALTAKDWKRGTKGMRETSVIKKGDESITPLHLACLNPNVNVLKSLLSVSSNLWIEDSHKRSLIHYAAACTKGIDALKYLFSKSVSLEVPDKEGYTPLIIASNIENVKAMEFIILNLSKDNEFDSKVGIGGVDRALKNSWCPIHLAAVDSKFKSLKVLLKHKARVDKPLNTKYGKLTALMLASGMGNLEMVKFLVEHGQAKVEALDKFKRSALTHAVMNGAANVASYLLKLGADPDRKDSSGNSNLHYACAYGWYHCAVVLLETGAVPDPVNEWKISPLAIAILRGHLGLGQYMLQIPGVCTNFQDDKGRTLLMELLRVSQHTCNDEMYSYATYLVDQLKINPCLSDVENKNVFHFLAENLDARVRNVKDLDETSTRNVLRIFDFLLEKGCNSCLVDEFGHLPIDYLFKSRKNYSQPKNYDLISKFLDAMKTDVSNMKPLVNNSLKTLNLFIYNINLKYINEEKVIFTKLMDYLFLLDAKNLIDMEKFRLNNSNLLFDICRIYANFPSINHKDFEGYSICAYNCLWELARDILSNFLKKFEPNLRKSVEKNKQIGEISAHSILLNANNEPLVNPENSYFKPAFEILCEYDKDFEAIDCDGITCLIRSIRSNNMVEFKNYIAKGANIFAVHEELNPMVYEEDRKDAQGLCCRDPLVETIISGNMEMFNTLLKAGAVLPITKLPIYPIFIVAVDKVINDRNNTDRMGILEQILALCKLQNDTTVDGFNALHLSINNSTDDFNINLEIESLLFKCGVNPVLQDSFGRIPLHYAFIKNYFKKSVRSEYKFIPGKGNNLSPIDPIEVVSMTIDGMQGKLVDTVDENGSSPLHYASYRGSTVCCMLLVDHNADINRMDRFGNTPLAYAIIGKHEATTITLLQKGANVNCKVHINPFLMGFSETQIVEKDVNQSNAFKFLPSHFKKPAKSQFPMTLFQLSLLNGWLGVSYLILERMEKHGLRIAEALEVAFKLNKLQLAKKLTLKQLDNSKLCELVDNKRNLISSMIKVVGNSSKDNLLIEFIFNHLYKAGNKLQHKDIFGCTVLHYGCLTNNIDILKLILSYFESKHIINEKDNNGRTPLVATLWKCPLESSLVLVKELLSRGADPNVCCNFKKFDYLHNDSHPSTVNLTYEDIRNSELMELTTPLIIAINFKCRSLIDLLLEHGVDVNLRDGKGRTPLMIAVKSNDLDFIKYFLNASISHIGSNLNNTPPLSKKRKFQKIMKLDIQAKDVEGYNVGHHALFRNSLFDASHDNVEVIKFLLENGTDFLDTQNMSSVSAVNIAEKMRLNEVYKLLTKVDLCPPHVSHNFLESNFPYNIVKDAQAMFDILSNKSCDENKKGDELDDNKNPRSVTGLTLKSGFLFQGYTALLSKICGDHGEWGIYNFYRMQIWKDQLKELYVLFTNWGRWGDVGNYQNTPFGRPEQAICEFEKIFKSKTGNDWSNRHEFVPKLNKYRQLDIKSFIKKSRPKIMFDLMTDLPSKLPEEVQTSIKHISNVAMYKNAYYNLGIDDHVIPFGQISRTNIQKAKTLLEEIQTLILEKKGLKDINDEPSKTRLHGIYADIQNKSNEYFYLMPKRNVSNTKIVNTNGICSQSEIRITSYLLEFEFAERVLLGAQYRKKEINPLDYIYNALSVELTPMKADDYMSNFILKYMYRSNGAKNKHQVDAIFKVSRKGNNSMAVDEFSGAPPKLLWHGTKCINLLSILNGGLVINPPYAERSGDTFGRGIYTADVYDKSFGYCDQNSRYSYMFLCKAALGKTFERDDWRKNNENSKDVFNSTSILGLYEPLSRDELYLRNGVRIPTGKITEHVTNKYRCFNYNEFIIKEESRLSTDYLVRIKVLY